MTIWVFENGTMVIKGSDRTPTPARSDFPTPMLSRMEPYESPITDGKMINSWSEREREMRDNNAYDPRDVKKVRARHG